MRDEMSYSDDHEQDMFDRVSRQINNRIDELEESLAKKMKIAETTIEERNLGSNLNSCNGDGNGGYHDGNDGSGRCSRANSHGAEIKKEMEELKKSMSGIKQLLMNQQNNYSEMPSSQHSTLTRQVNSLPHPSTNLQHQGNSLTRSQSSIPLQRSPLLSRIDDDMSDNSLNRTNRLQQDFPYRQLNNQIQGFNQQLYSPISQRHKSLAKQENEPFMQHSMSIPDSFVLQNVPMSQPQSHGSPKQHQQRQQRQQIQQLQNMRQPVYPIISPRTNSNISLIEDSQFSSPTTGSNANVNSLGRDSTSGRRRRRRKKKNTDGNINTNGLSLEYLPQSPQHNANITVDKQVENDTEVTI